MTRRSDERERALTAYLRQRADVEPSPALFHEVVQRLEREPQFGRWPRFGWRSLFAVPATALAAIGFVLGLQYAIHQLGGQPAGTDAPVGSTATAVPSRTFPVSPSESARIALDLAAGDFAVVASGMWPAWYDRDEAATPVVQVTEGEVVWMLEGPLHDDNVVWYRVQSPRHRTAVGFVWIRFADAAEAADALQAHAPRCPTPQDADAFSNLAPMERLACYGDEEITLGPVNVQAVPGDDPVTGTPAWLAENAPWEIYTTADWPNATTEGTLSARTAPGSTVVLESNGWYELRGHFDHAEAAVCERDVARPAYEEPAEAAILWCRQQFVITEATPVAGP